LFRRLSTVRTGLRETIQNPDATEKEIRAAAAKVAEVEADAAVLKAKLHKKLGALLTSEQKTKLTDMQSTVGKFVDHLIDRIGEKLGEQ
jgi:Spy/CpxP family protein refolding chaperone